MITAVLVSITASIILLAVVLSLGILFYGDIDDVFPVGVGLFVLFCLVIPLALCIIKGIMRINGE